MTTEPNEDATYTEDDQGRWHHVPGMTGEQLAAVAPTHRPGERIMKVNGEINVKKAETGLGLIVACALIIFGAVALTHCDSPQPAPNPTITASPAGTVPTDTEPLYVAQCTDVDPPALGPCVGYLTDRWIYVPSGALWPRGWDIELCPTEDGGTVPCAWLPSVQGNNEGDSGAYVFGVTDAGARPFPADEPAVALADCLDTPQGQGPCTMIDYGTDGMIHMFYVPGGFIYGDAHVRDMGVWQ